MGDKIVWRTEKRKLGELVKWEENPRGLTREEAERLKDSLASFGYSQLVEIEPDNTIIDGHQRDDLMLILPEYGADFEIEVRVTSRKLTRQERKKYIAYKHKGANGHFEWDAMANLYEPEELEAWGWTGEELAQLGITVDEQEPKEDAGARVDEAAALLEKWQVKPGDMFACGKHRIICGDSTDPAVIEKLMQGEKAALCVTDPPYGVNYDPAWRGEDLDQTVHGEKIANDDNFDWLAAFEHVPADVLYVWLASNWLATVQTGIEQYGFETRYLIIWNKDLAVFGRGNYHWKHEPCLYMVRKGATTNWQGARDQSTVWDIPTIHSFKNGHNSEEWGLVGHSNQKPLECMERPIKNNTAPGQVVVDLFLGSGTSLIACERLGRICRAADLEPKWIAVALQRYLDTTGDTPILLGDKLE